LISYISITLLITKFIFDSQLGEKYVNVDQFKEALTYYALANGFSLWYEKSTKKMIIGKCGKRKETLKDPSKGKQRNFQKYPSCSHVNERKWRIYIKWVNSLSSFQVISMIDEHTCVRDFNYGKLVTYKWLGRKFGDVDAFVCDFVEGVWIVYEEEGGR
jgi:hypothetical protein